LFVSANGEYIDAPNIDISIVLSKEKAIEKAKEYIGAKEYMWENESENNWLKSTTNDNTASFYPNIEIVICKNMFDFRDTTFYIAYKIDIYAKEPISRDYIFVDAKNGKILAVNPILVNAIGTAATRYSNTRSISTQQNGNTYRLRGYDNNRSIETYNMNRGVDYAAATDFTDNDNNWTAAEFHNANKDDAALEAHWGAMMTWDYFKNIHGRNSFDNSGTTVKCYVHYKVNYMNAFWDGSVLTFGDGNGTTVDTYVTLDVLAHEFGHGVCTYTADLVYSGESGALDEGLSDIWGACVSNYANNLFPGLNKNIWLHRIDVGTANRSLMDPHAYQQPDTYGGGAYWTGPNAEVHVNSGIMNHWFYILSVGKSGINGIGNAYDVTGISISKAEKIAYRAEAVYMTANTTFANARTYAIKAANDLYGICSPEVISTANAWYAVGVGNEFISTVNFTNQTVTTDTTVTSDCNINVQNVTITNGAKLTLEAGGEVNIISDFEVELGSEFEIK
jgi:Zn-dependent metalloprotease